ncbi:MAG: hypothetical protein WC026_13115 [Hyphomicrobium sp.]|uniref:hypothetical protein n=1 Tax=Hyphomicrobium sp. TaxID=82 RepID=UPI00356AB957
MKKPTTKKVEKELEFLRKEIDTFLIQKDAPVDFAFILAYSLKSINDSMKVIKKTLISINQQEKSHVR